MHRIPLGRFACYVCGDDAPINRRHRSCRLPRRAPRLRPVTPELADDLLNKYDDMERTSDERIERALVVEMARRGR